MSIANLYKNHATISNVEYSLTQNSTSLGAIAQGAWISIRVDTTSLVAGDDFRLQVYDKINGGAQKLIDRWEIVPSSKMFYVPPLLVMEGWEVTLTRIGAVDRDIAWSILVDDALTMNTGAEVIEGTLTHAQLLRLFAGMLAGAPVNTSGSSVPFKSLDGSKTRATLTYDATGRLTLTVGDLS